MEEFITNVRTITMKRQIILTVILFLSAVLPFSAQAGDDFGTWTSLQATKVWKNPNGGGSPYVMGRAEHRSFENASATEAFFFMAGGGCAFNKYFKADLSYEFWKLPGHDYFTTHKGVLCLTGSVGCGGFSFFLREKYEMAYTQDICTTAHTLRSRIRAQYAVRSIRLTPYLMYEFFNSLTGAGWIRSLHYAGAEFRFGRYSGIDIFYMYNLAVSPSGNSGTHILGMGYSLLF